MSLPAPVAAGESVVIVGAGQAGTLAAEALRGAGHSGPITLLGDEPCGPYHRPPLSKAWLAGEMGDAQLMLRAPQMLERKQIALRTGVRVLGLDRARQLVHLADGGALPYAGLVLATGAAPRTLALAGAQAPNVLALRSREDASRMAAALERCAAAQRPVVVIGGGFIGLEVAATARKKGLQVTVLEAAPRLLGRVLAPLLSDWFAALHRGHGVELVLQARVSHLVTEGGQSGRNGESGECGESGEAVAVQLADGQRLPCGLVVLGVGVQANDALAREAGLECEGGIVVDACARTSDPRIVAAGDCTARRLADGSLLRLESVHNATEQAKSAAAALLGVERPFTATPWFWSDQYERKLQMAGLSAGADAWALRGELGGAAFSVFHYRAGRLVAVDSVNDAKTHLLARKLLDAGLSPTAAQVADSGFDLHGLGTA